MDRENGTSAWMHGLPVLLTDLAAPHFTSRAIGSRHARLTQTSQFARLPPQCSSDVHIVHYDGNGTMLHGPSLS